MNKEAVIDVEMREFDGRKNPSIFRVRSLEDALQDVKEPSSGASSDAFAGAAKTPDDDIPF